MKRKILFIITLVIFSLFWPKSVLAGCSNFTTTPPTDQLIQGEFTQISFSFQVADINDEYEIETRGGWGVNDYGTITVKPDSNGIINPPPIIERDFILQGTHVIYVERKGAVGDYCSLSYRVLPPLDPYRNCQLAAKSTGGTPGFTPQDIININGTGVPVGKHRLFVSLVNLSHSISSAGGTFIINLGKFNEGSYSVVLQQEQFDPASHAHSWVNTSCTTSFSISDAGGAPGPGGAGAAPTFDPCKDDPKSAECKQCGDAGNVWSALGCIPTEPAEFVAWVLALAIKIGGGIAFLLMLAGGFTIMASSGNPEQINKGKGMITSAVSGLLFIIFSVLLLKVIGIDILQIPGWGQPFG